ncbi:uncharacterized protein FFB20_15865 [Fusarium fujikuroi]|nr:uncharacterized protein FFE2_00001 [Fusarium fujikuroi]SCO20120.1 uncharacterized protein FFB20_15865 [Fusarium fujikuroi]
MAFNSQ